MKKYGLIGERLAHSHSPMVHRYLADYRYELYPMPREDVSRFLLNADFDGLNVTIPYKKEVLAYLAEMGETAQKVGCVNTIVRRADGSLYGDNTDVYGMSVIAQRAGMHFAGRKTLILGSGGTSLTAQTLVRSCGGEAIVISRSGEDHYGNLEKHADADYLINTTPVGMYPELDASPVDLRCFPHLQGVLDAIYNPLRTRLLQQADQLGIPNEGGLGMLVYQAVRACELFTGQPVPPERAQMAEGALKRKITNLVLIGMPGCGKSSIGQEVGSMLQMPVVDLDDEIARAAGKEIPAIFEAEGEAGFRRMETQQLQHFASTGGRILVTGGGAVLSEQNRFFLKANGYVVHITRALEKLAMEGRPLSRNTDALKRLWQERAPLYAACADITICNETTLQECARKVAEGYNEAVCSERS